MGVDNKSERRQTQGKFEPQKRKKRYGKTGQDSKISENKSV